LRPGKDVTVVGLSWMNVEARLAADILQRRGVSIEIVDPRTLAPLDENLIVESVKRTAAASSPTATGSIAASVPSCRRGSTRSASAG